MSESSECEINKISIKSFVEGKKRCTGVISFTTEDMNIATQVQLHKGA